MPFVIGVLGHGGEIAEKDKDITKNIKTARFRAAMAAPAEMPEFKGNVINVLTEKFHPTELDPINAKKDAYREEERAMNKERNLDALEGKERKEAMNEIKALIRAKQEKEMTEDELFLLDHGFSNAGFHYYGSAKFFAQVGKAFAEALVKPEN